MAKSYTLVCDICGKAIHACEGDHPKCPGCKTNYYVEDGRLVLR